MNQSIGLAMTELFSIMKTFLILTFFFLLALAAPVLAATPEPLSAATVFDYVNSARTHNGLPTLIRDRGLETAAQARAIDILQTQRFAHTGPRDEPFYSWIEDANVIFIQAAENLAKDFYDPATLVKAWLASPTHRVNILDQNYQRTGVATATGLLAGAPTTIVVQLFSQPKTMAVSPREPNLSLPPIVRGEVLGVRAASIDRGWLAWFLFSLLLNATIVFWLLDHWHWHRRVDRIFTK